MKTIGMIGGLSWHSSLQMYEYINQYVADHLGQYNCAKMVLANVNLQDVFITRRENRSRCFWKAPASLRGCRLRFLPSSVPTPCTSTRLFLSRHIKTPLLHIADATAEGNVVKRGFGASGSWEPASPWRKIFTGDAWKKGAGGPDPSEADRRVHRSGPL